MIIYHSVLCLLFDFFSPFFKKFYIKKEFITSFVDDNMSSATFATLSLVIDTFWLKFERFCSSLLFVGDVFLVAAGDFLDDGRYGNRGMILGVDCSGSRLEVFLDAVGVASVSINEVSQILGVTHLTHLNHISFIIRQGFYPSKTIRKN